MLTILTILLIWNQFGGWFRKMFCKIGLHTWIKVYSHNEKGWHIKEKKCRICNKEVKNDKNNRK